MHKIHRTILMSADLMTNPLQLANKLDELWHEGWRLVSTIDRLFIFRNRINP